MPFKGADEVNTTELRQGYFIPREKVPKRAFYDRGNREILMQLNLWANEEANEIESDFGEAELPEEYEKLGMKHKKRACVFMHESIYAKAKGYATDQGISLSNLVCRVLRGYISQKETYAKNTLSKKNLQ